MACQPGYIELADGTCVYDFGSDTLPDGTPKGENNTGGGFWDNAGDFVKDNAGNILVILGGILGAGKNNADPIPYPTQPLPDETPKKDRTLLWVGLGLVALVVVVVLVRKFKGANVAAAAV